MAQPQIHADAAAKQRAYRLRQAERIKAISEGSTPPPPSIGSMPATQRWNALQAQAQKALELLRDEMQAYYDARTEQWQEGERGTELQGRIETVESLLSELEAMEQ